MATDDTASYVNRVRAEIEAEAVERRRRDPELERLERDIERAWVEVAPPGAAGSERELLLDRADRLSMIDVDVPVGNRLGVRQVKTLIRKGTYWYLRYVSDQLNALHNVLTRLTRRLDRRVTDLERAVGLGGDDSAILDPPPGLGPEAAATIATELAGCAATVVLWCADGAVVRELTSVGVASHGVDQDPTRIVDGVAAGHDLRVGDPATIVAELEAGSVGGIVAAGGAELWSPATAWGWTADVEQALPVGGMVAVAVADPATRVGVEAELRQGRGLSPEAWAHLLDRRGFDVRAVVCGDPRVNRIVIAVRR